MANWGPIFALVNFPHGRKITKKGKKYKHNRKEFKKLKTIKESRLYYNVLLYLILLNLNF